MRFWDASAIVAVLLDEAGGRELVASISPDPVIVAWWGTPVEVTSAIARREREGGLPADAAATAIDRLRRLSQEWQEILPSDFVRTTAQRLLRVHALRAADSLQLAAAITAAERDPSTLDFVCLDERLNDAARREGFALR